MLTPGARGDLVLLTEHLRVVATVVGGEIVYDASEIVYDAREAGLALG